MTQAVANLIKVEGIREVFILLGSNPRAQAKIIAYQADDNALRGASTHVLGLKVPQGDTVLIEDLAVLGFQEMPAPPADGFKLVSAPLDVKVSHDLILRTARELGFACQESKWLVFDPPAAS